MHIEHESETIHNEKKYFLTHAENKDVMISKILRYLSVYFLKSFRRKVLCILTVLKLYKLWQ